MSPDPLLSGLLLFLILLLYGLCTACQTSIASIREVGRSRLSESEDKNARTVAELVDEPENFQTGTHLLGMALEAIWFICGVLSFYRYFPLKPAGAIAVTTLIAWMLIWFFGRMFPRRVSLNNPEGTALRLCPLFRPLVILISPLTALFLLLAKGLMQLLKLNPNAGEEDVSEDEIMALVESGEESGAIQAEEKELIENVFEFNNMTAEDVMIHRTEMSLIFLDDSPEKIMQTIVETGYSRFPVCGENSDDVRGILNVRDYLLNQLNPQPQPLVEILRSPYFVPESVATDVLFRDMQSRAKQIAIVVDEYGGTSGLVTMEDLLEELVGNIYDEFDTEEEQEIIQLSENLWRMAGSAEMEAIVELLELELTEDDEETLEDNATLGGLIFSCLSVIPEEGATPTVSALGMKIQVESISDRRVEWALVSLEPREEPED